MNESVFIGTYPGLTKVRLEYMVATTRSLCVPAKMPA